jgi:hypothetical protein
MIKNLLESENNIRKELHEIKSKQESKPYNEKATGWTGAWID